jgi:hypothetical protein
VRATQVLFPESGARHAAPRPPAAAVKPARMDDLRDLLPR